MLWFLSILFVVTVSATSEKAWLREVKAVNTKRGQSPYLKQYDLTHPMGTTRLSLQENRRVNPNAPVFEAVIGDDGTQKLVQKKNVPRMTTRFFHDRENDGAFMMVYNENMERLVLTGALRVGDHWYHLSPAPIPADAPLSDDDSTLYILEKQTTNSTNDKVQNTGNDVRDLPVDGNLSSEDMKETPISEKQRRKIKRKLSRKKRSSQLYAVELLIVVDFSLWERFYDDTNPSDEAREEKLREYFSHIVSGMSLRYENIEDPELNMYVTISGFIFYKQRDSTNPLPLTAEIIEIGEDKLVNGTEYLFAIVDWVAGLPPDITADHIAVFTDYDLYQDATDVNGRSMSGVAFLQSVCTEYGVFVMEASAFHPTVSVASHELGHGVGAGHDGYGQATDCPEADKFIMRAFTTYFEKHHAYTQNPWKFSSCSIQGFKDLIQSGRADCLLDNGDYYDRAEYESHLERLPGEVRTLDEQCQQLYGVQSRMCSEYTLETEATFCQAMTCYKPTDGLCYYTLPARGTHCGQPDSNTWCIEGQCVAKTDEYPQGVSSSTEPSTTSTTTEAQGCTDVGYVDENVNWDCHTLADYFYYFYAYMPSDWCPSYISVCCDFCSSAESTYTAPECVDVGYVSQNWSCQELADVFLQYYDYAPEHWCRDINYKSICCQFCAGYGVGISP